MRAATSPRPEIPREPPLAGHLVWPEDCTFLVGLPTSRAAFESARADTRREYVRNRCPAWGLYEHDVVRPAARALAELRTLGVRVIEQASLRDFAEAFTREGLGRVVILLAPAAGRRVELADGLTEPELLVGCVLSDCPGLLDLSACHPPALAERFRARHPRMLIETGRRDAPPAWWFRLYLDLFRQLKQTPRPYLAALEDAVSRLDSLRAVAPVGGPSRR